MPASPTLTATLEMSRIKLKVKISRVFHSTWTKINVALLVVTLELSETCNHLSQRVSRATRLNILLVNEIRKLVNDMSLLQAVMIMKS